MPRTVVREFVGLPPSPKRKIPYIQETKQLSETSPSEETPEVADSSPVVCAATDEKASSQHAEETKEDAVVVIRAEETKQEAATECTKQDDTIVIVNTEETQQCGKQEDGVPEENNKQDGDVVVVAKRVYRARRQVSRSNPPTLRKAEKPKPLRK